MKNKIFFIIKILLFITFQFFILSKTYSEIIDKFEIRGNERVSDETIIMFSKLKWADDITLDK